jgi:hypothetical protein
MPSLRFTDWQCCAWRCRSAGGVVFVAHVHDDSVHGAARSAATGQSPSDWLTALVSWCASVSWSRSWRVRRTVRQPQTQLASKPAPVVLTWIRCARWSVACG